MPVHRSAPSSPGGGHRSTRWRIATPAAGPFLGFADTWDTAMMIRTTSTMPPMTNSHIHTPRSRSDPSRTAGLRRTGGSADSATGPTWSSVEPPTGSPWATRSTAWVPSDRYRGCGPGSGPPSGGNHVPFDACHHPGSGAYSLTALPSDGGIQLKVRRRPSLGPDVTSRPSPCGRGTGDGTSFARWTAPSTSACSPADVIAGNPPDPVTHAAQAPTLTA